MWGSKLGMQPTKSCFEVHMKAYKTACCIEVCQQAKLEIDSLVSALKKTNPRNTLCRMLNLG